ncbi:hypothetical protein C0995_012274 [Termitomyces sp. Mi166|nr:hypothetical protein C0995_012274 [Termitomyces sp. Mi166\
MPSLRGLGLSRYILHIPSDVVSDETIFISWTSMPGDPDRMNLFLLPSDGNLPATEIASSVLTSSGSYSLKNSVLFSLLSGLGLLP